MYSFPLLSLTGEVSLKALVSSGRRVEVDRALKKGYMASRYQVQEGVMTTMASSGREEREMIVTVTLGASGRSLEDVDDGFGVRDGNIWDDMVNSLPS